MELDIHSRSENILIKKLNYFIINIDDTILSMLVSEINIESLHSEFIDNLDGDLDIPLIDQFSFSTVSDFNNRSVRYDNINEILSLCDYLMISDTWKFIMTNLEPRNKKYILNELHKSHYNLPKHLYKINLNNICKHGLLKFLKNAHKNNVKLTSVAFLHAAQHGQMECIQYLQSINCPKHEDAMSEAALYGHLEMVKYLVSIECQLSPFVNHLAALNGHLDILKYLESINCATASHSCGNAAKNGHLECLKYLVSVGTPMSTNTCANAASNGHLDCLVFAVENGCLCNGTWFIALGNGHLECIKYLKSKNLDSQDLTRAPTHIYKHFDCVKWLNENEYTLLLSACSIASYYGNLELVKYLCDHGYSANSQVIFNAASNGHLDILKYAYDINETMFKYYIDDIIKHATNNKHDECINWLLDKKINL